MDQEIIILGGGRSGIGAALLAKNKRYSVFLSDCGLISDAHIRLLNQADISFEQEKHSTERILAGKEVIKSPGIPDTTPIVVALDAQGTPVIDEIEWSARFTSGKIIGITGSNGKTTTALLTYHILKKAGFRVGLAGNIGQSLGGQLMDGDMDYWVLELSSFQLDRMYHTPIHIAVLLNITPDHLDRYQGDFERYVDSKCKIMQLQTQQDHLVYFDDDKTIKKKLKGMCSLAKRHGFSLTRPQCEGAWLEDKEIITNVNNEFKMSIQKLALQGKHNLNNTMAASIISQVLEIRKDVVRESMSDFQNVPHRLEKFISISHVEYINDSKATNVNATWYALESMDHPTVWIVGGEDKGNDYTQLTALIDEKVKFIIALGKDVEKIHHHFGSLVEIYDASDMRMAVGIAYSNTQKGDTVLLSPCCASFDMYENYKERGDVFKSLVRSL